MPLYEYQCQSCDHHFERIERASSPHDGVCPSCGGSARRLLGAPALKFKGSGWYVTDYGKGNGSRPAQPQAESSANPESGSKTSDTSSSKSESTTNADSKADSKVA